jgi:hypothetical protein
MLAIFILSVTVVYKTQFLPPTFTIIVYPRYVAHYQKQQSINNPAMF